MKASSLVSWGSLGVMAIALSTPPIVAAVQSSADPHELFADVDAPGALAIAHAEGNRSVDGTKNPAYFGHTDPGNGAKNLGQFSWQAGGCNTPAECDRRGIIRLQQFTPKMLSEAEKLRVNLDNQAVVNGADLVIQAPLAAGDYISRLKQCQSQGKTGSDAVLCARVSSYINPATGRLEASGFGNNAAVLERDQLRRMEAIDTVLSRKSK